MNKEFFISIFKNIFLYKLIFNHVHLIHKNNYNAKDIFLFKWSQIKDNPELLAKFNIIELIQQYYNRDINKIIRVDSSDRDYYNYVEKIKTAHLVIIQSLINGNITILKYMFEEVIGESNMEFFFYVRIFDLKTDVLRKATAMKSTTLEIVEYLQSIYQTYRKPKYLHYFENYLQSPQTGKLEIVKWFENKYSSHIKKKNLSLENVEDLVTGALISGSVEIVQWLLSQYPSFEFKRFMWLDALRSCSIDLLNYLISNPRTMLTLDRRILYEDSIGDGRPQVVEWLYKNGCIGNYYSIDYNIDRNDNPEYIDWIFHFFKSIGIEDVLQFNKTIDWYCYYTRERSQRFFDSDNPMPNTLDYAILNGHLNILKWLHMNQVQQQCTPYYLHQAHYKDDNLELVEWLYENRTERCTEPFTRFRKISIGIQRFILDYYTELVPIDVLRMKSKSISYEMFEYIIRNYPQFIQWNSLIKASYHGNIELVKIVHNKIFKEYQHQHSTGNSSSTNNGSDHPTAVETDLEFIQHQSLRRAIGEQHLEVIQFLFENAIVPIESNINDKDYLMDYAIVGCSLQIIKYLHNNTVCKLNSESVKRLNSDKIVSSLSLVSEKKKRTNENSNETTTKKSKN